MDIEEAKQIIKDGYEQHSSLTLIKALTIVVNDLLEDDNG